MPEAGVPPMIFVIGLWTLLRAWLLGSTTIALENLALRHQLLVLQRSVADPVCRDGTGSSGSGCPASGPSWRASLVIVQPATVLAWHRRGFQLYWRWRSRASSVGRPRLDAELRDLIRRMARENPTWGRRRIRAELALLGYEVAELTVAKYMHRTSPRPSPTWRVFLTAHARDIVAIDFFVVPTLTFRLLVRLRRPAPSPPRTPPRQRDGSPVRSLDGPAGDRGVPGGDRPEIPTSGSRLDLRRGLHSARRPPGDPPGDHGPQSALAEPVCGASHRLPPSRVPRPLHHSERSSSPPRSCARISPTTTPRGHTNRLTTTVPGHESSNPPPLAGSSPSLRSADFITATLASPDRGRPAGQPSPARAIHPDWNGQSAPQSAAAIHATILITLNTTWFRTFAPSVRRSPRLADEVSDRHSLRDEPPALACEDALDVDREELADGRRRPRGGTMVP